MIMKPMLRHVIFILSCLLCTNVLIAQELPNEATLPQWHERADKGDSYAMYVLGYYYSDMEEYPDNEKAFEWFLKSAEKGYVLGEYVVSRMYFEGDGVEQNTREGIKWLRLAVRQRYPDAVYALAMLHIYGTYEAVEKDPKEGFRLLKQAAALNHREACYCLGMAYYEDCDWETADAAYKQRVLRLMTRAANQGDANAQYFLAGLYYVDGDETIPRDVKKALEWMTKVVQQCETFTYQLAPMYIFGEACDVDVPKAIECLMASGKPEYQAVLRTLACCFLLDDVVKPDDKEMLAKMEQTVAWLKEESDDGDALAKMLLEAGYEAGKTDKEDIQKTVEYVQIKAEQGDTDAMFLLGLFEEIGVGRERNLEKAVEWMKTAAEKEHADAELAFWGCLCNGYGTKRNIKESREFLKRAAEHGSVEGREYYNNQCQWELYLEDLRPSLLE